MGDRWAVTQADMPRFFSIRTKFLVVMSALLMACVGVYLLIAVKVFRTDKTELVFDLNRSMVSNLSAEMETQFSGVADKFKLFALLSNDTSKILYQNLFGEESDVAFVSLYRGEKPIEGRRFINAKYLETYGLKEDYFNEDLPKARPIPFQDILRQGESFWNATSENGTPLIGYGRSVLVENSEGRAVDHLAVVGYIKPDKILKAIGLVKISEVAIVDRQGHLLLHQNPKWMESQKSFSEDPLYVLAKDAKVAISVASIQNQSKPFLGAFAKSYQDKLFVLARAPEEKVFSAVESLVVESLLFALIVITTSLLFAVLLSRSLTDPILTLVDGMKKVATGDLNTEIKVKSRDETQLLARSFNQMIVDLRQSRDELQEINRELDQKVKERTHQLEIQSQAVKEAQEALLRTTRLASAGEIAGRTAHEVLNPLTGILTRVHSIDRRLRGEVAPQLNMMGDIFQSWRKDHQVGGFQKLIESWKENSAVHPEISLWEEDLANLESVGHMFATLVENMEKDVQFLLHEGARINKIVDGMRKLSNLSSDVRRYSVRKLLVDCRNIMADLFAQADIKMIENFEDGPDEIEIDRDEFIQAVTNLMRNALQAMKMADHKQEYCMKLEMYHRANAVVVEISDNGHGIEAKFQDQLFKAQFTTRSAEEGTGLGLGISRRFIRAHGGDIEFVSSIPYQETRFRITLPMKSLASEKAKDGAA